ncbi:hypothetical protein Q5P01_006916 [Channa striata]|uniref:ZP domain-containing protein n=1 Tax=Channa striata TaxID=64152 RepID=A0AA88T4V2_CHASR|nr:hypothetical protein Q5P01_006916 [Channa striata]
MASVTLLLLHLLLMVSAASAWWYNYYGGQVMFTPKGQRPDGTFEVEFRDRQASPSCYQNSYTCYYGDCGSQVESSTSYITSNYYPNYWCQNELKTVRQVSSNLPFGIRYPSYYNYDYGSGYWISNSISYQAAMGMMAHVDMGIRSDTGLPNSPPVTTTVPVIRIPRNCPRSLNLTVFDPDGDQVRCRVPTDSSTSECGLCGLPSGFSLNPNSCSLTYTPVSSSYGYYPIELMVEDFPKSYISVHYSDGSYATKGPLSVGRHKRQISSYSTFPTTTTEAPQTTSSEVPWWATTTTEAPQTTSSEVPWWATTTTEAPQTTSSEVPWWATTTTEAPQTTSSEVPWWATTTTEAPQTTSSEVPWWATTTTEAPQTTSSDVPWWVTTQAPTTITESPTTTFPTTNAASYRASIPPLSKLPLQFIVYVDSDVPSCLDGDYIPIFLSPTPSNGATIPAYVNRTLEIKVRSSAQYTTVFDLIVTGPSSISKQSISTGDFIISWTPTQNELNKKIPICFFSQGNYYYYYYWWWYYYQTIHSELRCVTADVGHHDAKVTCSEKSMKVELEKDPLIRRYENKLHLNDITDYSCNLNRLSNSTHLVAEISLNECGTFIREDDYNIIFKNQITSADPNEIISRNNDVEVAFECSFPKRNNLTLGYIHKNPYVFTDKGFGTFTFQFEFFESQLFLREIAASRYPVEVDLKQMMFLQIEANTSIPNVQLFVESVKATPYDSPNSRISYTIIENGCVKDRTVQIYPGSQNQFRFGMEAFEFIGAYPQVYITCSVILCETGVPGTRCSQGCISSNYRHRREAAAESSRHSISQGPLRLAKASDAQASGLSINLGMNFIFIIVCLLGCGVVIYRVKRSKVKYQLLPLSDSD